MVADDTKGHEEVSGITIVLAGWQLLCFLFYYILYLVKITGMILTRQEKE